MKEDYLWISAACGWHGDRNVTKQRNSQRRHSVGEMRELFDVIEKCLSNFRIIAGPRLKSWPSVITIL